MKIVECKHCGSSKEEGTDCEVCFSILNLIPVINDSPLVSLMEISEEYTRLSDRITSALYTLGGIDDDSTINYDFTINLCRDTEEVETKLSMLTGCLDGEFDMVRKLAVYVEAQKKLLAEQYKLLLVLMASKADKNK